MGKFEEVYAVNVNGKTEEKNGLTYLSWAWAWAEFKKVYPNATYEVEKFNGLPYVYDEKIGYMVYTKVKADELEYEMWLPVMDSNNKTMLDHPYEYTTKFGKKGVNACTMFDINKTIMRCLTKNLAMFGLGLYIYAGEDLPEETDENKPLETNKAKADKIHDRKKDVQNKANDKSTIESVIDFKPITAKELTETYKVADAQATISALEKKFGAKATWDADNTEAIRALLDNKLKEKERAEQFKNADGDLPFKS